MYLTMYFEIRYIILKYTLILISIRISSKLRKALIHNSPVELGHFCMRLAVQNFYVWVHSSFTTAFWILLLKMFFFFKQAFFQLKESLGIF